MLPQAFVAAAMLACLASAIPLIPRGVTCVSGVHIIVARASTEQQGEGIIGSVATDIKNRIPNSDSVAVVYPATLYNYNSSESMGVTNMTRLIKQYVNACGSKSRVVLLGYSQGAQVVGDTLLGPSGTTGGGLPTRYRQNIIAAIQMGDPTHLPGQSFDVGTSTNHGIFPRSNVDQYTSYGYAPKLQSYCDTGDNFCDSGDQPLVHFGYVQEYGTNATDFVVSRAS